MSYSNPLHPPVQPCHQSPFYSIAAAIPGQSASQSRPQFTSSRRQRLPQFQYVPSAKWSVATGKPLHRPITFDFIGYINQGVPMRELSARGAHGLAAMVHGANDQVLAGAGAQRITLRILWPGYAHVEWARSIEVVTAQGPITRAQLGAAVAKNFAYFVEKTQHERSTSAEWRIGPTKIRYEHLILVALWNVYEDNWQADVAIEMA